MLFTFYVQCASFVSHYFSPNYHQTAVMMYKGLLAGYTYDESLTQSLVIPGMEAPPPIPPKKRKNRSVYSINNITACMQEYFSTMYMYMYMYLPNIYTNLAHIILCIQVCNDIRTLCHAKCINYGIKLIMICISYMYVHIKIIIEFMCAVHLMFIWSFLVRF